MLLLMVNSLQAAEPLTMGQAIDEALATNPGLAAIQAKALALSEVSEQAATLPDPRLSLNLLNLPLDNLSFTEERMTQLQLGISQTLPYPGKLALHSQIAEYEAGVAEAGVAEQRLQLVGDIKTVWWNLYYLDRALEVIQQNQGVLGQIINVAQTRYQVGQGQQQDILLAQLELTKLRDSAIQLNNMRHNEVTRLNLLLGRSAGTPVSLPIAVTQNLPSLQSVEQLQQYALTSRPALAVQQGVIDAARTRIDLAKREYAPDFQLGAIYGLRNGSNPDGSRRSDLASIMFSMNLPLYTNSKQDRMVDQRNAEWMQQKYRLQDQRNQVATQVQQAISDYHYASERVELFQQQVIPQANQTVEAMLAGYQVGRVDFLSLLGSQTTLYDYQTQYWKALSTANQALARLVAAVGKEDIYE